MSRRRWVVVAIVALLAVVAYLANVFWLDMVPELALWLVVSKVGIVGIPFVIRRRLRELTFHRESGMGHGAQWEVLRSRQYRAAAVSVGVILCSTVALSSWLIPDPTIRRWIAIPAIMGIEVILVGILWGDEFYADRIEHAPPYHPMEGQQ